MVLQTLLVQRRNAMEQVYARILVVGEPNLNLENADELLPLAHGVVDRLQHARSGQGSQLAALDALQRTQRRAVIRHQIEDVPVQLHGPLDVRQVLLVELGDAVSSASWVRMLSSSCQSSAAW